MITIVFVIGLILLVIFLSQPHPDPEEPTQNGRIMTERSRDNMLYDLFYKPTPWQQMNTYVKYKGDNFMSLVE